VRQACEALAYVHSQRVVHRDVKPANLILGEHGVVLVDFGIAREGRGAHPGSGPIGTPLFMSPEVLAGGVVSPRSDVFGLGATLWTLVAGKAPGFLERSPLSAHAAGVGRAVDAAVGAALEPDPYLRLASVETFAQALGEDLGPGEGASLGSSIERAAAVPPALLVTIARSAAGVFGAAAASIALVDRERGELVYAAAWGAGAEEIVGVRLAPGTGIAGAVLAAGEPEAVPRCRDDARFAREIAAQTGYEPNTMLVFPMMRGTRAFGILQVLDRRDGGAFAAADLERGTAFVELALAALAAESGDTIPIPQ
jgi:hypothetical protein